MNYRINAQGNVMAYGLGMWTTLPPKKGRSVLFAMTRRQLLNLIPIVALAATLPTLTATLV